MINEIQSLLSDLHGWEVLEEKICLNSWICWWCRPHNWHNRRSKDTPGQAWDYWATALSIGLGVNDSKTKVALNIGYVHLLK